MRDSDRELFMKCITQSERQTISFAKKFAKQLRGGEVITLSGALGAGKTTFVKGLAKGLGIKKIITSPTFILMNVYKTKKQNVLYLTHIDCYRIDGQKDIENIGAQEYFGRKDAVVVIEWAEKIQKILPKKRMRITIKIGKNHKRMVLIKINH